MIKKKKAMKGYKIVLTEKQVHRLDFAACEEDKKRSEIARKWLDIGWAVDFYMKIEVPKRKEQNTMPNLSETSFNTTKTTPKEALK